MEFFIKYEDRWDWGEGDKDEFPRWINDNPKLPCSTEFIERYKDKIQWELISQGGELILGMTFLFVRRAIVV